MITANDWNTLDSLTNSGTYNTSTLTYGNNLNQVVNDAYNGIADVTVYGNSLTNTIVNPDFSNGTTGWTADVGSQAENTCALDRFEENRCLFPWHGTV
jgi:hypothetical protein